MCKREKERECLTWGIYVQGACIQYWFLLLFGFKIKKKNKEKDSLCTSMNVMTHIMVNVLTLKNQTISNANQKNSIICCMS